MIKSTVDVKVNCYYILYMYKYSLFYIKMAHSPNALLLTYLYIICIHYSNASIILQLTQCYICLLFVAVVVNTDLADYQWHKDYE